MMSGLMSQLNPEINPWHQIEKYGQELLRSQATRELGSQSILALIRPYLTAPAQLQRVLAAAESGRLRVQSVPDRETLRRLDRLEKRLNQLSWSVLGAAGIVSAVLFYLRGKGNKS
jgi:hypothetical protein